MPTTLRWHQPLCLAPRALQPWLAERGSLTARLIAHYPAFSVRVLRQRYQAPHDDELQALQLHRCVAVFTRDVLLLSGSTPVVYAHSVATRSAVRGDFRRLRGVGNKSLGSMLFADPTIRRSPLAWRQLDPRHPLWQQAQAALRIQLPSRLWARRSLFLMGSARLLVTEVFLPPVFGGATLSGSPT